MNRFMLPSLCDCCIFNLLKPNPILTNPIHNPCPNPSNDPVVLIHSYDNDSDMTMKW